MQIDTIRRELRHGTDPALERRRRIGLLAAAGAVDFALISLYQFGIVRHLPDPPGRIFDSDRVNASRKAYALGVPDGALGLGLYALTLILSTAGGSRASGRHPVFDVLLGGAVAAGVIGAGQYLYDMVRNQARACPYCLTGAAAHFAMAPLVAPLVVQSVRELRRGAPATETE
jgi:uncharacterized membrane protein